MRKTDISFLVDHAVQWHTSQLEQVDFLSIFSCHSMIRVRQTNERDVFILPILLKRRRRIGTYRKDFSIAPGKPLVIIPQARQLRAAIRSHESAQEGKDNWFTPAKIRKTHKLAVYICQFKVRSSFSRRNQIRLHFVAKFSKNSIVSPAINTHCSSSEISAGLSPD